MCQNYRLFSTTCVYATIIIIAGVPIIDEISAAEARSVLLDAYANDLTDRFISSTINANFLNTHVADVVKQVNREHKRNEYNELANTLCTDMINQNVTKQVCALNLDVSINLLR